MTHAQIKADFDDGLLSTGEADRRHKLVDIAESGNEPAATLAGAILDMKAKKRQTQIARADSSDEEELMRRMADIIESGPSPDATLAEFGLWSAANCRVSTAGL